VSVIVYPNFKAFDVTGLLLAGGKLHTYYPGTTTNKATYTDKAMTTAASNPITLSTTGEATIYGSGSYKLELRASDDSTVIWTVDNVDVFGSPGSIISVGSYSNLNTAVTSIGSTPTELWIDSAQTLTGNLTVPATLSIKVTSGGSINLNGHNATFAGDFDAGSHQVFSGSGTVTFPIGKTVRLSWFASLAAAVTALGTSNVSLLLDVASSTSGSVTVPATLRLVTELGNMITQSSTLAINSVFTSGDFQVFAGTGAVTFASGTVTNPRWWFTNTTPGTTDVSAGFQRAITATQTGKNKLHIPNDYYYLGSTILTVTSPIDVSCDDAARMRWSGATGGWLFDLTSSGGTYWSKVDIPALYGPAVASNFVVPGYPGSQDESTFVGTGVHIKNAYGIIMSIQHMLGWEKFLLFEGDATFCGNHTVNFGVMDMAIDAIHFLTKNSGSIDDIKVIGNTTGGRCLTLYECQSGFITGTNVNVNTSFCNSPGDPGNGDPEGAVYGLGTNIYNNAVTLGRHYAGYQSDGPLGVPTTFKGIYIGGDQTRSGETGWFGGDNNIFTIGNTYRYPDSSVPLGGGPPVAGDPIRVKMSGGYNKFIMQPDYFNESPKVLSATQGESHYNGGVGGASMTKYTLISVTVTSLSAGATKDFYFYHQGLTPAIIRNIDIGGDYWGYALDHSNYVPREVIFTFVNHTAGAVTGTYPFWIKVE